MANLVKCVKYISTEADVNKNRYWFGFLYDDATVEVQWGRVGNAAQSKKHNFPHQKIAEHFLSKKCAEKEGPRKGYRKLNLVDTDMAGAKVVGQTPGTVLSNKGLDRIAKEQIKPACAITKNLIDKLVAANVHSIVSKTTIKYNSNSGLFTTPLGIVTQEAIDEARELLKKMRPYVQSSSYQNRSFVEYVNSYLMLIPQNVGRKLDVKALFPRVAVLTQQNDILDSLEASLSALYNGKTTSQEKVFDVKIKLIEDSKELDRIERKYNSTVDSNHSCCHLKFLRAYEVCIADMKRAYDKMAKKVGNVQEMWHGTRKSNVLSILSKGLVIPQSYDAHVTARMFGNGVYFADCSTKSLNYSYGFWSGETDQTPFMFMADVALGKSYLAKSADEKFPIDGYDSTYGKRDHSSMGREHHSRKLKNDEYIVYQLGQCNLTRLVEFSRTGR